MNSRAERYWLLMAPESWARPPVRPPVTLTGGQPSPLSETARTPIWPRAVQQLPQGPLAEALGAGEEVLPFSQGGEGGEEAHGGAGVAQVNGQRRRQPAAAPARHPDGGALPVDAGPQLRQGLGRELGVFGRQGIGEDALPRGQGRGHQGPVGVALGPGQGEGGLDLLGRV